MSEPPVKPEEDDALDEIYRRLSARDQSGPSESVRRAVLDHAARLAAERAASGRAGTEMAATRAHDKVVDIGSARRRSPRSAWLRPAAVGTLAAAGLAGLLIAPQFLPTREAAKTTREDAKSESVKVTPTRPSGPAESAPSVAGYAEAPPAPAPERPALASNGAPAALAKAERAPAAQDELEAEERPPSADSAEAPLAARQATDQADINRADINQAADTRAASNQAARAAGASAASSSPAPAPQATTPMAEARLLDPAAELRHAASIGDLSALRAALERQPVIDARDAGGHTALMLAVLRGHGEAVNALLAAGADPNATDARDVTPLQAALGAGETDIAASLRRSGAK
jgi:Meckel syndrome type 1 protein